MRRKIPESLRNLVSERAFFRCEYCRIHQDDRGLTFPLDHFISIKHDGSTDENNLAFSCPECNRNKGSDLGGYITGAESLVRFFNPRIDLWEEHFENENGLIRARTLIGQVTIRIFQLNTPDRIIFRQNLISLGRYP